MKLTIEEISKAVQAKNDIHAFKDVEITNVEFDSRKTTTGSLFVPLEGNRDGHDFIPQVIESGASATFVKVGKEVPSDFPYLLVEDVLKAFQDLAKFYLEKTKPTVIAVTGSNGKTTTKDMTASLLATTFPTYKTQGNYNNEIGMPYTILSMPEGTEKIVLEMGMDHPGDLHLLSTIAQPEFAAITLIGESHLEFFGTRENISKGKFEIVDGLQENGVLVYPADEPLLTKFVEDLKQETIGFGWGDTQEIGVEILEEEKDSTRFKISFLDSPITIPYPGKYNARNALVAAYLAKRVGVSDEKIVRGLEEVELTRNRTEWKKAKVGTEILSDVYNANPTAMALVLDSFQEMPTDGNRIAVLGDMLELGETSIDLHKKMSHHLDPKKIEEVYLVGEEMRSLYEVLLKKYDATKVHHFEKSEKEQLIEVLKSTLHSDDLLVVKASNGIGLSGVVEGLES